jgi:hypothetical protein
MARVPSDATVRFEGGNEASLDQIQTRPDRHQRTEQQTGSTPMHAEDAATEAKRIGQDLVDVAIALDHLDPDQTVIIVERLIDVAATTARAAGIAAELEPAISDRGAPAVVRRRVLGHLASALCRHQGRTDSPRPRLVAA